MTTKHPMTVAELIERLGAFPPDAVVMTDCPTDPSYNGAIAAGDLELGEAVLLEEMQVSFTHRPFLPPKTYPRVWILREPGDTDYERSIVETRTCVRFKVE